MGVIDEAVFGRALGVPASGGQPAVRSFSTDTGPFDAGTYQTIATYMFENVGAEQLEATIHFARLNADGSVRTVLQECTYSNVPPAGSTFDNRFTWHYDPQNTIGGSCFPADPDPGEMRVSLPNTPEAHYGIRVFRTGTTPPSFDAPGTSGAMQGLARSWSVQVNAAQLSITACSPPAGDLEPGQTATFSATVENTGSASGSPTVEWTVGGENLEMGAEPETITRSVTVPAGETRTVEGTLDVTSTLIEQLGGSNTYHVSVVLK